MAVRFDANADYLRIASGLFDYNAGYTIMAWAYPVSNPAAQITLFSVAADGSNLDRLRSNSGGTTWSAQSIIAGSSVNTNGSSVSYASWQHWALVRRDASNLDTYLNGTLDATSAQSVSGRTAAAQLDLGNTNAASAYFNGRVFAIKIWNAALSAAEIQQEMRTIRPIRLANLWAWVPGRPGAGERAKDYSGNGRSMTEGGTLTDEDAGPISWGARRSTVRNQTRQDYTRAVASTIAHGAALTRAQALARPVTSTIGQSATFTRAQALARSVASTIGHWVSLVARLHQASPPRPLTIIRRRSAVEIETRSTTYHLASRRAAATLAERSTTCTLAARPATWTVEQR